MATTLPNTGAVIPATGEKPDQAVNNAAFTAIDTAIGQRDPQSIVLTPATGITLVSYKAYKTNNIVSFSLYAQLTSGEPFVVGSSTPICTVPPTPADSLTPLNSMGYTVGGMPTDVKHSRLEKWNRTVSCANQTATTKTIYISGFYFV